MRASVAHRRMLTPQHGEAGSQENDLCRICERPDNTQRHKLVAGLCGACYGWWLTLSTRSTRDIATYLEGLNSRVERFSIRANVLAKQRAILPEIHHKPKPEIKPRPTRL